MNNLCEVFQFFIGADASAIAVHIPSFLKQLKAFSLLTSHKCCYFQINYSACLLLMEVVGASAIAQN